jgi:hypothetical protein
LGFETEALELCRRSIAERRVQAPLVIGDLKIPSHRTHRVGDVDVVANQDFLFFERAHEALADGVVRGLAGLCTVVGTEVERSLDRSQTRSGEGPPSVLLPQSPGKSG